MPMTHHETSHAQQDLLNSVAEEVARADDLQTLSRPLLDMLQHITGLSSVYLTEIDWDNDRQHIRYSRNTGGLVIPEGLSVPWGDTLCRRSLDENRRITTDVGTRWGDSEAARELGIETYASVPVRTQDGEIFGTLCAASNRRESVPDNASS